MTIFHRKSTGVRLGVRGGSDLQQSPPLDPASQRTPPSSSAPPLPPASSSAPPSSSCASPCASPASQQELASCSPLWTVRPHKSESKMSTDACLCFWETHRLPEIERGLFGLTFSKSSSLRRMLAFLFASAACWSLALTMVSMHWWHFFNSSWNRQTNTFSYTVSTRQTTIWPWMH